MVWSLRSTLMLLLPTALIQRVRLASLLLVGLMLGLMVLPVIGAASEPAWTRALLLTVYGAILVCWIGWYRGRAMRPFDLALEGVAVFWTTLMVDNPVAVVPLLYTGTCYRPYFSTGRNLVTALGTYAGAFLAGAAISAGDGHGFFSPEVISQPPTVILTGGMIYLFARGILKQEHLLTELTAGKHRYQSLVESIPGVIMTSTADGIVRYVSPQVESLVGVRVDDLQGTSWASIVGQFIHEDDRADVFEKIEKALANGKPISLECRAINPSQDTSWVRIEGQLVDDGSPDAPFWQTLVFDVTEVHSLMDELSHQAFHDALTGLPNRALFNDRVDHALSCAKRHATLTAVCFFDLDDFKVVNDSIGHKAGDTLIIEASKRLQSCLHASDTVARFGGDEFALLLEDLHDESDAVQLAERVIKEISKPFMIDGHAIYTSASIGIAFANDQTHTASDVVRFADVAMYEAKRTGKSRYTIFEPRMEDQAFRRMETEAELRHALEHDEFRVAYQPIVDLATGEIKEVEALIRWQHPTRGLLGPAEFLDLAEQNGLILSIGSWILREACQQTRIWQVTHPDYSDLVVSVNLSPRQLHELDLVQVVADILGETGLAPRHLQLEVAEDAMLADIEQAIQALSDLSALGVEIAIDDFGTGNSSLGHLRQLPIQTMKIDRSYVAELGKTEQGTTMLRAMVTLAKTLGMDVTAEGIETLEQTGLHGFGCDYGQGFYFAKPQLGADMEMLLDAGDRYTIIDGQPSPLFSYRESRTANTMADGPIPLTLARRSAVPNGAGE